MAKKPKSSSAITQVVNSDDSTLGDRLSLLKSRLEVAKTWSKKPHEQWKKWMLEYEIEDFDNLKEIRDKVRIGYIFRRSESDLPAMFDDQPDLFIKGKGQTQIVAPLITGTYEWLWDIQNLEEVIEDTALYMIVMGMGFIESPWVTKTKKVVMDEEQPMVDELGQPLVDEMGQPAIQSVPVEYDVPIVDNPQARAADPFKLFFSPETKFNPILDYEHCPYYFKEHVMTKEEIKARFNKDVDAGETLNIEGNEDVNHVIDTQKEQHTKDDMKRVTVFEYYGCLPEAYAKGIKGAGKWQYDKDYHIFFTNNEELVSEECQYDYKPMFIIGNYGFATKFFKFGDAKHLMPLVQELQVYRSQILRHTRKMANPKPLIPTDAEVDEKAFTDPREGTVVKYTVGPTGAKPEYLQPASLGREVTQAVDMVRTDLEKTSGSFDLASGGSQSTVRSPRGIAVYSEAADKTTRRKRKKIARLIRQLIIFQFKQLAQNWEPDETRTIDVISEGEEQAVPVIQEVLDILGDDNILAKIDIEIESLSLNRVQMKQDALDLLDTALKSEAQTPGLLKLEEIWKDVIQNAFNKKDPDRYLYTQEERQMKLMEQQQLALASQGIDPNAQPQGMPPEGMIPPEGEVPPPPEGEAPPFIQ